MLNEKLICRAPPIFHLLFLEISQREWFQVHLIKYGEHSLLSSFIYGNSLNAASAIAHEEAKQEKEITITSRL